VVRGLGGGGIHRCVGEEDGGGGEERGELENRVTKLMQETRDCGDVILM
jgi:hypothetical protein